MKKLELALVGALSVTLVAAGYTVPIGSYDAPGCFPNQPATVKHLHYILGESIESIKAKAAKSPVIVNVRCGDTPHIRYVQYLL